VRVSGEAPSFLQEALTSTVSPGSRILFTLEKVPAAAWASSRRPAGLAPPIGTSVPAGADSQPAALVSVTERETFPEAPAVKVTWLVPCPSVRAPLVTVQAYVEPAWDATEAVMPVAPGRTQAGAVMYGRAGVATVTAAPPEEVPGPLASETAATV